MSMQKSVCVCMCGRGVGAGTSVRGQRPEEEERKEESFSGRRTSSLHIRARNLRHIPLLLSRKGCASLCRAHV